MNKENADHLRQLRRYAALLTSSLVATIVMWLLFHTLAPATTPVAHAESATMHQQWGREGGQRSDGGGDSNDGQIRWEGVLLDAPDSGFVGAWVIQFTNLTTGTVTVDAVTRVTHFGDPPAPVGIWIKAEGVLQPDGSLLAEKIEPEEFEDGQVVVRFAAPPTEDELATFANDFHLNLFSTLLATGDIYLFTTDDDEQVTVATLLADARVRWAELNYVNGIPRYPEGDPYRSWEWGGPDDSGYVNQNAYAQVNLAAVHTHYTGAGVIVAVLDTGVDLDHPALRDHLLPGRDVVADDAIPMDEGPGIGQGHGTHVAGIIAALAPGSQLLPVRVLDANGRGNTFLLAYAVEWATAQGADVINLSLGADFDSAVLSDTLTAAQDAGVIVVAAVGNDNHSAPQFPAFHPAVLGVTAVDGATPSPLSSV